MHMPIGNRLKQAREQLGWKLEQVSERTGIGVSSLSEFENGRREPRVNQLRQLASAYRKPISYFFDEAPVEPELILWRERPPEKTAAEIEARFLELIRQYDNVEQWCKERVECVLPQPHGDRSRFGYDSARSLARVFRSRFALGDRPAFALQSALEELCGVKIFHLSFDPSGTAACSVSESRGAAILLNSANKRWRRNFDLAHELFHLLTWRIFREGTSGAEPSEQEETFANAFASHLLLPTDAVKDSVSEASRAGGVLKCSDLFDVARQFDISTEALLWRIHFIYRRSEGDTRRDIDHCNAMRSAFERRSEEVPSERPERFRSLVLKALQMGEISTGRAAEYLGISRREAMGLMTSEGITDDEVSLGVA